MCQPIPPAAGQASAGSTGIAKAASSAPGEAANPAANTPASPFARGPGNIPQPPNGNATGTTPAASGGIDYGQFAPVNGKFNFGASPNGLPQGFDFGQWAQKWGAVDPRTVDSAGRPLDFTFDPSGGAGVGSVNSSGVYTPAGGSTTPAPRVATATPTPLPRPSPAPAEPVPLPRPSPTSTTDPIPLPKPSPTNPPAQAAIPGVGLPPVDVVPAPTQPAVTNQGATASSIPAESTPIVPVKSMQEAALPTIPNVTAGAPLPVTRIYRPTVVPGQSGAANNIVNAFMRRYKPPYMY